MESGDPCETCGNINAPDAAVCGKCGTPLTPAVPTPSESASEQPPLTREDNVLATASFSGDSAPPESAPADPSPPVPPAASPPPPADPDSPPPADAGVKKVRPAWFVPVIGLVGILVIGGVAFAAVKATGGGGGGSNNTSTSLSLAAMLPATTVGYGSIDLSPSGATATDLNRIKTAFTSQPGWNQNQLVKSFLNSLNGSAENGINPIPGASPSTSTCSSKAGKLLLSDLKDLGHQTTLAMTSGNGLDLKALAQSPTDMAIQQAQEQALMRDVVVLIHADIQTTVLQSLAKTGLTVTVPLKAGTYSGTTIYKSQLIGCNGQSPNPNVFYTAIVNGWTLIGLNQQALHPVIDTSGGHATALSTVTDYTHLMAQLPTNQLATGYESAPALKRMGLLDALNAGASQASSAVPNMQSLLAKSLHSTAVAVTVDGSGISVEGVTDQQGNASNPAAGQLAASLPSTTDLFVSVGGLKDVTKGIGAIEKYELAATAQLHAYDLLLSDITADMSGEGDVAVLQPPAGTAFSISTPENILTQIPLTLTWQVNNQTTATNDINAALQAAHITSMVPGAAKDGTTYYQFGAGGQTLPYGYAIRKGWVIVSPNIAAAVNGLGASGGSLASRAHYKDAVPSSATASSIFYANVGGITKFIESSVLPGMPVYTNQYNTNVKPLLDPIDSISGSTGRTGTVSYTMMRVDIG
jgi:hypothetical protein